MIVRTFRETLLLLSLVPVFALAATGGAAATLSHVPTLTRYVNPFIGTDGTGHTFPGAAVPFGMVAPSPDNADRGWDFASGYQFNAPKIMGFSNTHISGAGIPELGDVLLQPVSGTPWSIATTDFSAAYDKQSEHAQPGYYRVTLSGNGVTVELTATARVALQRYRFTRSGHAQVLVDLQHGMLFGEGPRVTRNDTQVDPVKGEITGTTHSRNWVEREASFVLHFDRPIAKVDVLPAKRGELAPRYLLTFALGKGRMLEARIALSTVDVAGARKNLTEAASRRFERVRADADRAWEKLLGRIRIDAPEKQKRIFYSALYRTMLHPSDIADIDGRVRGPTGQVIAARGGHYYSTLSLWDTFRGVHPLFTLVVPERVDGMILSLLDHHKAQGYLPLWTAWGRETWTMIGNPSLPVIADAVAKGFTGFDREEALNAMLQTSTAPRPNAPEWAQRDWRVYDEFGFLPFDRVKGEAVSQTLELGIGDDAVARVAALMGRADVAMRFGVRAKGYRKLFDIQSKMMRGKDSAGNWRTPFDPLMATSPMSNPGDYTEANAWQYTLTPALHDPDGLVEIMGGPREFGDWLDRFFSTDSKDANKHLGQEAMIGQYAHGNEPSHHIAYLYAWTDRPWKSPQLIRRIVRDFYTDQPNGIIGNDDCGQMSAWYVLSTLGFYPVVPGSGNFVLGAPQVRAAKISLPRGKMLRVIATGFSEQAMTVKQSTMRGESLNARAVPYSLLMRGGELQFNMVTSR